MRGTGELTMSEVTEVILITLGVIVSFLIAPITCRILAAIFEFEDRIIEDILDKWRKIRHG